MSEEKLNKIQAKLESLEQAVKGNDSKYHFAEKLWIPFLGVMVALSAVLISWTEFEVNSKREEQALTLQEQLGYRSLQQALSIHQFEKDFALVTLSLNAIHEDSGDIKRSCSIAGLIQSSREIKSDLIKAIENVGNAKCEVALDTAKPEPLPPPPPPPISAESNVPQGCQEAKVGIDWVLFADSGAMRTYLGARATGLAPLESVLVAQGHNAGAQATIQGCGEWARRYIKEKGF